MTTTDKNVYRKFGHILAYYRGINKMTQKDVADAIGVGKSTYTYYEYGERRIPLEQIVELSNVLGFDLSDVMKELKTENKHDPKWFDKYASVEFSEDEVGAIEDFINYTLSKRK